MQVFYAPAVFFLPARCYVNVRDFNYLGCGLCQKGCPAGAISNNAAEEVKEGKKLPWKLIDQSKCVKCGACEAACKFHAVLKK